MAVEAAPAGYVAYYPAAGETRERVAAEFGVAPDAVEERDGVFLLPVPSPRLRLEDGRVAYVVAGEEESFLALAARFLGDPLSRPLLWPPNRRREVAPGIRFVSRPRRLRAGWRLTLPGALAHPSVHRRTGTLTLVGRLLLVQWAGELGWPFP